MKNWKARNFGYRDLHVTCAVDHFLEGRESWRRCSRNYPYQHPMKSSRTGVYSLLTGQGMLFFNENQ